ncbi:abortive infection family protein [Hyphomonadaceae bacterium BL14]|nr:abortive infection family protein [Hyphomonadaceae bacterium BL14]
MGVMMKLSQRSLTRLREAINGDTEVGPTYRSGPALVSLFNEFGADDVYPMGGGFPSRWMYTDEKLQALNGTPDLKRLIVTVLDPLGYDRPSDVQTTLAHLNAAFERDGFRLVLDRNQVRVSTVDGGAVEPEAVEAYRAASKDFVHEYMNKCRDKLGAGDFSGAITNARTLVEQVLIDIERELDRSASSYDGDLPRLQKRVHRLLSAGREPETETVKQLLRGLETVIGGLSGASNKLGDRHPRLLAAKRHHAKLAVNTAFTLADFYLEAFEGHAVAAGEIS